MISDYALEYLITHQQLCNISHIFQNPGATNFLLLFNRDSYNKQGRNLKNDTAFEQNFGTLFKMATLLPQEIIH